MHRLADPAVLNGALEELEARLPYTYAQFLEEEAATRDYRVVADRIPNGGSGYAIAHRTGVIGQVFRHQRPIFVPNTRNHPLYDPFDTSVDWELAIPLFLDDVLMGVLNVEGPGALLLGTGLWTDISRLIARTTRCAHAATPPDPRSETFVPTQRLLFADEQVLLDTARWLASEHKFVLMIAALPELVQPDRPTLADVERQTLPLAECIYGVAAGIDMLTLETNPDTLETFARLGGWSLVNGRYDFILGLS